MDFHIILISSVLNNCSYYPWDWLYLKINYFSNIMIWKVNMAEIVVLCQANYYKRPGVQFFLWSYILTLCISIKGLLFVGLLIKPFFIKLLQSMCSDGENRSDWTVEKFGRIFQCKVIPLWYTPKVIWDFWV